MGQSTEELTRDIEQTRSQLSRNVDELGDKVSPGRIAHRQKEAAKGRLSALRDQVMGTVQDGAGTTTDAMHSAQDSLQGGVQQATATVRSQARGNPLAAGLVAFGAGMVLSAMFPATDAETQVARQGMDAAKEHGGPVIDQAKQAGQQAAEHLQEEGKQAVAEVRDTASDSAAQLKEQSRQSAQQVADTAKPS